MGISTKTVKATDKVSVSKLGSKYNPKKNTAQGNAETWEIIQKELKGGAKTVGALTAKVAEQRNHAPFVGYAIRRGWLKVG